MDASRETTSRTARRGLCFVALLALAASLSLPAAPGFAATHSGWVRLAGGFERSYLWSVRVSSRQGPEGAESPGARRLCLLAATAWRATALEYHRSSYRDCSAEAAPRRRGPPLLAASFQSGADGSAAVSAVGMIFAPSARRVRVVLAGGDARTVPLRLLGPAEDGAGVGRLRYAAFAMRGTWCAERLTSFGPSGEILWDSGTDEFPCGSEGTHFASTG